MPGKKPKERQRYMLRINDTLVEVTREVYLAWYQAGRKERYQVEKMQRHGVCSMEELQEKGYDCSFSILSPEEIVIRMSEIQELEEAMRCLAKEEAELIWLYAVRALFCPYGAGTSGQHGPNFIPGAAPRRLIQIYQKNLNGGKADGSYHQL